MQHISANIYLKLKIEIQDFQTKHERWIKGSIHTDS